MTKKLKHWTYQNVTDFLKENKFDYGGELADGTQMWITYLEHDGPDRIVEVKPISGVYTSKIMNEMVRMSNIPLAEWREWGKDLFEGN
ncbi:MAG TPA: hypothetical protein VFV23_10775 [Verrucomicrobiae bacterium]|nr:hypothetical protein [Verrucomicrobiae bacterium]